MGKIDWHAAFFEAIQYELEDYIDVLEFVKEFPINEKPRKVDTLIIKKPPEVVIDKNFAWIFRKDNLFEYKNPNKRAGVKDFVQILSYCTAYSDNEHVPLKDITATLISGKYPKRLMQWLDDTFGITKVADGIYYLTNNFCVTQILVSEELSEENNLWLADLRSELESRQVRRLAEMSERLSGTYFSYWTVIVEANRNAYAEIKDMTILEKVTAKRWAEGKAEGKARAETVTWLKARFGKVPQRMLKRLDEIQDVAVLQSLAVRAENCESLKEFAEAL